MESQRRNDWDLYFFDIANQVSNRSTCRRRHVGAVGVNPRHRIIATGYNGAPSGMKHCTPETCIRIKRGIPSGTQLDLCKAIHAEANIVLQVGDQLQGGSVYCTTQPCTSCLKLLIGAGVERICWQNPYADDYAISLMAEFGTLVRHLGDDNLPLMDWDIADTEEQMIEFLKEPHLFKIRWFELLRKDR